MFIQFMPLLFVISQDDITGDGTTSNVLIIGELLKQVKKQECQVNIAKIVLLGVNILWVCRLGLEVVFLCHYLQVW